jgi:hypothetical protein
MKPKFVISGYGETRDLAEMKGKEADEDGESQEEMMNSKLGPVCQAALYTF